MRLILVALIPLQHRDQIAHRSLNDRNFHHIADVQIATVLRTMRFTAISGCSSVGVAALDRRRSRAHSVLDCDCTIEGASYATRGFAKSDDADLIFFRGARAAWDNDLRRVGSPLPTERLRERHVMVGTRCPPYAATRLSQV